MPFLLLADEAEAAGGGGVEGYMSCCDPSRDSSSDTETNLLDIPSLLLLLLFPSKVKLASPFLLTPTSYKMIPPTHRILLVI